MPLTERDYSRLNEIGSRIDLNDISGTITVEEIELIRKCLTEEAESIKETSNIMNKVNNLDKLLTVAGKETLFEILKKPNNVLESFGRYIADAIINIEKDSGEKDFARNVLTSRNLNLSSYQRQLLLLHVDDEKLIDESIKDTTMYSWNRVKLICHKDENQIKQCIEDPSLKLDTEDLFFLLEKLKEDGKEDKDFYKKILYNKKLSKVFRVELAIRTKDYNYIKETLKEPFNADELAELLKICTDLKVFEKFLVANADKIQKYQMGFIMKNAIKKEVNLENGMSATSKKNDRTITKVTERYVKKFKGKVGLTVINNLISETGNKELNEAWKKQCRTIGSLKDLSIEQIEKQREIKYVRIVQEGSSTYYYTREEYIKIQKSIDTILSKVGMPKKDDFESELNAFNEIFKSLSYIKYDKESIKSINDNLWKMQERAGDLYGGIIDGKTVCRGYANILKQTLDMIGIESRVVSGYCGPRKWAEFLRKMLKLVNIDSKIVNDFAEGNRPGHAWNQVKIGGKWYNVDLTNYRSYGERNNGKHAWKALKDDFRFKEISSRYKEISGNEKCDTRIETEVYKRKLKRALKNIATYNKHTLSSMENSISKLGAIVKIYRERNSHTINEFEEKRDDSHIASGDGKNRYDSTTINGEGKYGYRTANENEKRRKDSRTADENEI